MNGDGWPAPSPVKTRLASAAGALARDFLALLTSLRQADRDGLFPALHLAAFAALAAPQRAMLPLAHRSLGVFAGTSAIFASARLSLRHVALPPRERGITRSTSCSIRTLDTAPGACPPAQRPRDREYCSLPVWQASVWRPSQVWWPRRLRPPGFRSCISGKSSDENLLVDSRDSCLLPAPAIVELNARARDEVPDGPGGQHFLIRSR